MEDVYDLSVLGTTGPECPDGVARGLPCYWHGNCSRCGELIHLAELEHSDGWDLDPEETARFTVGDPPVCHFCRSGGDP